VRTPLSLSVPSRTLTAIGALAAFSAVALVAFGAVGSASAQGLHRSRPAHRAVSAKKPAPRPIPAKDAVSAVVVFSSQVESLGAFHYPNSFAGATLTSAGVTEVYAVKASDARLVSAIRALDKSRFPVRIIGVSRSYSQLNALNAAVGRANAHLRGKGISISESWPDPSSGSVAVTLTMPTRAEISALASAVGSRVTSSTYRSRASSLLKGEFGTGVKLQAGYQPLFVAADRTNDRAPFYSGDRISSSAGTCTTGFNLTGNAHGTVFAYTAGHCGNFTWKTTAATVGSTSTNYFSDTSGNDFESIQTTGLGIVWLGGTTLGNVGGRTLPAVGDPITFNGSITGQIRGNPVGQINATISEVDPSTGETATVTNQVIATNSSGTWICRQGDSGGPVYEYTSPDITAVGDIVAYAVRNTGDKGGAKCAATQINHMLVVTNSGLLTN
jgi:hypothetical protein